MWSLRGADVVGVRRAVDVKIRTSPDTPVVVLFGPTGSGKSSTEIALAWLLAGEARTLELGRLNKDEIRNDLMNAVVDVQMVSEEGEVLEALRTLTMSGSHDLIVNGAKFKNLTSATDALEEALGCSTDQLGYLTSAQALVSLDGLEQAQLLLGLMGPEMTWADLEDRCAGVPEPPVPADTDLTGYPLIEAALSQAETKRTEAGREKRAAETAVETANGTLMGLCREARVPGPGNIAAALTQAQKGKQRDTERLEKLQKHVAAAEAHSASLLEAQERLAVAEADVAALKAQRAEADEVREEREAERSALAEKLEKARAAETVARKSLEGAKASLADKREELATAQDACDNARHALDELRAQQADAGVTYECPDCQAEVAFLDGELVYASELPGNSDSVEQQVMEAEQAEAEANAAVEEAQKIVAFYADEKLAHERAARNGKSKAVRGLEAELAEKPALPPAEELERKYDAAKTEADAAYTKLEELRGKDVPTKPQPEALEATRKALEDGRAKLEALTRAQAAAEAHTAAQKTAEEKAHLYDRYNALVDRLREIIREVAEEAIKPVLERSNNMLAGRLTLGYSADAGIQAVYSEEEKRPVRELSTGERLMVGVTLQASVAVELGVGVCLVDDTSNWDLETQRVMHEEMVTVGREHGITWLCASTHEPLDVDGVTTLPLEGGYSS